MIFDLIGKGIDWLAGKDQAEDNYDNQKEFAQSGIQWKTADAKKAGVHPLAALGAQTMSFTPSAVGDPGFSDLGSKIDGQIQQRATQATETAPTRMLTDLAIEKGKLENEGLHLQNLAARQQLNPPMASVQDPYVMNGQTQSGVTDTAMKRIMSAHGHNYAEAGPVTDVGFTRTSSGGLAPVYSSDAKERLEDDWGGMAAWNLRNRIAPSVSFGALGPTPPSAPKQGYSWVYNPLRQEYVQVRNSWPF